MIARIGHLYEMTEVIGPVRDSAAGVRAAPVIKRFERYGPISLAFVSRGPVWVLR
jgi:hypothetical protein